MNINRHNYEEYFLLYVDNELTAEERLAVQEFVEQNEDRKTELEMLQQATLSADNISFDHKEILLKKEEGISLNNYEEYFLLSVDNELSEQQQGEVEKFVLKHPQLQDDFILLHKTRLVPEPIPYKNKEELYRRERRVVPIIWMRLSVAAAILGIIAFSWLTITNNNSTPDSIVVSNKKVDITTQTNNQPLPQHIVTQTTVASLNAKTISGEMKQNTTAPVVKSRTGIGKVNIQDDKTLAKKEEIVQQKDEDKNSLAAAGIKKDMIEVPEPQMEMATNKIKVQNRAPIVANTIQPVTEIQPVLASQAVYKQVVNTEEEDKSVYIGNLQINKNKIKSLFKKASGIFGKKTDKEPNEKSVQVAGFEIRTT